VPEFDVARQRNDIILKRIASAMRGDVLRRFGLSVADIVEGLPSELPMLEVRSQQVDLLFLLTDESILHLEFQSNHNADDLKRFFAYNLAVYLHYDRPVQTVIFYGPDVRSAPDELTAGSLTFRTQNVLLGQEDGTTALHQMYAKVQRSEPLSEEDRAGLMLLPLMRQSTPLNALLPEVVAVAQALPVEQRATTIGALVALAWRYVDEEWAQAVMEVLNMPNMLDSMIDDAIIRGLRQGLEQGLEQGREQGRVEGKRDDVRVIVRARFGTIPAALEQRIAAADVATLDDLIPRAATAERIEDLG
jgi:hypothetical protein